MKHILMDILAVFCLLFLCGCGGGAPETDIAASSAATTSAEENSADPLPSQSPTPEERAAALTSSLTLEEKVGQLFFVRCPETAAAADVPVYHLGGFLLFGRDFQDKTANEIVQTLNAYQEAAAADTGIPLLIGTDEEGGTVVRVSSNPSLRSEKFRSPQQLYADGGMEEIVFNAHEKDVLLKALGINVNFSPVCDVSTNPEDFIYRRAFGQDAEGTSRYVSCVVDTMSGDGMGSVLKHFPGYGSNGDTHTGTAVDSRPLETFQQSDFLPFSAGISASLGEGGVSTSAILVSHNQMACVDPSLPASLSPAVHALLRQQLGFNGVIMTDDLAMDAVQSYPDAAVLALQAGNDMVLTTDYHTQIPQVLAAVRSGTLEEGLIDAACTRVLVWKLSLGLIAPGE